VLKFLRFVPLAADSALLLKEQYILIPLLTMQFVAAICFSIDFDEGMFAKLK
jgi:hypothetical protein